MKLCGQVFSWAAVSRILSTAGLSVAVVLNVSLLYLLYGAPPPQGKHPSRSKTVKEFVNAIKNEKNTIILTTTNFQYIDFFENLMLSMKAISPKIPKMVAVIAEDYKAYSYLSRYYPDNLMPMQPNSTIIEDDKMDFFSQSYKQLASRRPNHLLRLLELGVTILFVDVDTFWLQDPFAHILPHTEADMVVIPDRGHWYFVDKGVYIYNRSQGCLGRCCGCFLYMKPTRNVKKVLSLWAWLMERRPDQNQVPLNRAIDDVSELKLAVMDPLKFPSGSFYFKSGYFQQNNIRPTVIHANFEVGHFNKKRKFLKFKHWYFADY